MTVRPAREADVGLVLTLIRELAEYERLTHEVVATEELLREALFGERPVAEAAIAEADGSGGPHRGGEPEPAGFVLWYTTFSTFQCLPGAWVEDLFVRPEHRGAGIGRALLEHLRSLTDGRVEWAVRDWNEPSIAFYESLGAKPVDGWLRYRWDPQAR